ncbi:AAA family ATPase [Nocardioides sp. Bht2]|uniref:AAA family ATPase n=1 Tax=Nocardioides sp. Bht2 TaxID=3392297 RepID=UPI0039B39F05
MRPAQGVLLLGHGAAWEAEAVATLGAASGLVVLKRCLDLADLVASAATGQAQVVVLGGEVAIDAASWQQLHVHGVAVVVIAPDGDDAVLERWRRAGARVVLAQTDLGRLVEVLRVAAQPAPTPAPRAAAPAEQPRRSPGTGRVTVVWGPAGSPGRTTVALGLAAVAARRGSEPLLLDLDPWGGTVAQQLGLLEEVSGLLACNRSVGELATRFVGHQRRAAGLRVLTGLPRAERCAELRPELAADLIELAKRSGPVLVDTGFCLEEEPSAAYLGRPERNALTFDALALADQVVVVGTPDPVGLGRLARGLAELRERTSAPVEVVVNRMRRTLGWREADVVAMLSDYLPSPALHFLPEDRETLDRALALGRTLPELGESPLSRAMARLADAVLADAGGAGSAPVGSAQVAG